jgi:hypothetical protein
MVEKLPAPGRLRPPAASIAAEPTRRAAKASAPAPSPEVRGPDAPPEAMQAGYRGAQEHTPLTTSNAVRPMAALMQALDTRLSMRSGPESAEEQQAERLLSRRLRRELKAAFGPKEAALFQLPSELMKVQLGAKALDPALPEQVENMLEVLARAQGPGQDRLPPPLVNRLFAAKDELAPLLRRVVKNEADDKDLYKVNQTLVPLLMDVARARGIFMAGAAEGEAGFVVLRAMRPEEKALATLEVEDPAAFEIAMRRKMTFAQYDANVQKLCAKNNLAADTKRILGALVTVGEDRATGEQIVFSPYTGALPMETFLTERRAYLEAKKLAEQGEAAPVSVESLDRLPDKVVDALPGEVRFASLTDDRAKQSGLTRILPVKAHEGVDVVVEGRFKGLSLDQLVNQNGRMIEGAAYTYEPATGRSKKLPNRPELADKEPYITVTQKQERGALRDKLFLMMPFKQGEWTELRQAVRKLSERIPSIQYVPGSKNTSFYFDPKDFAVVRDTLKSVSLSSQALASVKGYYRELAEAEQAAAPENLELYALDKIGGFKAKLAGPDGEVRPVALSSKQRQAIAWLEANGGRGVCALDTGMGKTLTAIATMQKMLRDGMGDGDGTNGKFLFVCPPALRGNLAKEIHRFMSREAADELLSRVDVMSYAQFRNAVKTQKLGSKPFRPERYGAVFFDEAQALKNPSTKTAQAALALRHPHKICLTASPMEKNPMEAYVLSCVANNIDLSHRTEGKQNRWEMRKFKARFCETFGGRIVGLKDDPLAQRDLHTWVKRNVFYADKRDLPESPLPPLEQHSEAVVMPPEVEKAYRKVAKAFGKAMEGMVSLFRDKGVLEEYVDDKGRARVRTNPDAKDKRIARAMGIGMASVIKELNDLANMPEKVVPGAGYPKIDAAARIVKDRLRASKGESRAILFSDDREMVLRSAEEMSRRIPGKLHAACLNDTIRIFKNGKELEQLGQHALPFRPKAYRNDPDAPANKTTNRHYPPAQWQQFVLAEVLSPHEDVLSATLLGQTYQTGQNLQAFDTAVHLDRDTWCSEDMNQRTARLWRQGQENPVTEYVLDAVYEDPKSGLDGTLDEVRKFHQVLEGELFNSVIKAAQTMELGAEWFEMRAQNTAFLKLDRETLELMVSPRLQRARPRGERDVDGAA